MELVIIFPLLSTFHFVVLVVVVLDVLVVDLIQAAETLTAILAGIRQPVARVLAGLQNALVGHANIGGTRLVGYSTLRLRFFVRN